MRRIFFATGTLVLAMSMWATAPAIAAEHGHVEFGHSAGVGSIHFGPHEAPVHAGPAAPAGPARSEHIAGPASKGTYRNPYSDDYFKHFPPGYHPFVLNGAQYYGYYSLPLGFRQLVLKGITYFLFGGVYYQAYIYGGQTVYLAVPPPV
ncbi:MAG: hypothetical protein ACLP9L_18885 [Thermoguttaceae bacterium]